MESNRSGYKLRLRRNERKQDLTAKNQRWINYALDHLRTSPITGIALSYLPRRLHHSNQDLSLFDLSRSSSFPQAPASSIYVLSLDFPRFSLAFATSLDFPRFLSTYAVSLEIPALSGFPALSVDYVAGIPALSSICGIKPRSPASTISRVFHAGAILISSHSIESIRIKLISSLVLKK